MHHGLHLVRRERREGLANTRAYTLLCRVHGEGSQEQRGLWAKLSPVPRTIIGRKLTMEVSSGGAKPCFVACADIIFLATGSLRPKYRSCMFCLESSLSTGISCLKRTVVSMWVDDLTAHWTDLYGHSSPRLQSPFTKNEHTWGRFRL